MLNVTYEEIANSVRVISAVFAEAHWTIEDLIAEGG